MRNLITFLFIIFLAQLSFSQTNSSNQLKEIRDIDPYSVDVHALNSINLNIVEAEAYMAFIQQDYRNALKKYLYIVNHNVDHAKAYYIVASCYAAMGYEKYASSFLVMAVNRGFSNYNLILKDEIFDKIRNTPSFQKVIQDISNLNTALGKVEYVKATKLIRCRVILPVNYDSLKTYPMVIGLHGYGGCAENFSQLYSELQNPNFIFVVPESPYIKNDGNGYMSPSYSWDFHGNDRELWKISDPLVISYIADVVKDMQRKYPITKTYLLGFSQGVAYAYTTALKNTDIISGLICFAGFLPDPEIYYSWFISEDDLINGKQVPVYIAHGKYDNVVSMQKSIDAKKKLKKLDYKVKLSFFEGGHFVSVQEFEKAIDWHFSME